MQSGDVAQLVRALPCHGRGRGFEPRRPRHTFQKTYGIYGTLVTIKSGHNTCLIPLCAHAEHNHLNNLALCGSLVPVHGLRVNVERDLAIGVS